jgi:hypothetical protein
MREWHVEHMQKTTVKFVIGLSDNASSWQKRQHKKYNNLTNVRKNITYDMKHGVTNEEVFSFSKEFAVTHRFQIFWRMLVLSIGWMK